MLSAVEFDGEAKAAAGKVRDEVADGVLAGELCLAELACAQVLPKAFFRLGGLIAQFSRAARQAFFYHRRTPIPNPFPQGKGLTAFVALTATIATPALAQHSSAATTQLEGPAAAAQGSGGASALDLAVLDRAAACGMDPDALTVRHQQTSAEPRDEAGEAALDAQVEDISAKAGFTGPRADRQASRAGIRAMLTQRLRLTLEYTGENGETGMACLVDGLAEAGFEQVAEPAAAPFTQDMADAISDACKADRAWLVVLPNGALTFQPPMESDYAASVCVIQTIKDAGVTKFGFVGNDKAAPDE